jgi:hypothetical protein
MAVAVLGEAGLWASNGSQRFQERYLMVLLPLVLPAFLVYLRRGRPARAVVCVLAVAMLGLSARVPLSGYSIGDGKQDSPLLFAVFWLERRLGVANGSMLIAILAAVLSCLAAGIAFRARLVPLAIGLTVLICGGVGAAAVQFDRLVTDSVRSSYLPRDAQWIDHAHVGDTVLVQTPATPHVRAHEELFWNRSLKDLLLLAGTSGVDSFRTERVEIARGGTILRGGKPLRRPLAISNFAVNVQLSGATRVASGGAYDLWTPAGTPRLSLFAGGLYHDHWLAQAGHITVWPDGGGRVRGVLRLVLSLPKRTEKTPLRVTAPGVARKFSISPGERKVLEVPASARGPWTLRWRTSRPGYVDDRPISVKAETPTFTRLTAATCPTLPRSTLV